MVVVGKIEEGIPAFQKSSGHSACCLASLDNMEKELLSDAIIEAALKNFAWGGKRANIITLRAILREAIRLAKAKA